MELQSDGNSRLTAIDLGVSSWHLMGWVEDKAIGIFLPLFTDEFVCRETAKGFESSGEVVCSDEVGEVNAKLLMVVVVVALHSGFLNCSVPALDLSVGPGMVGLGEAVIDAV